MKLLFGIIILIVCVCLGYKLSLKFTDRKKFYCDFLEFNSRLKSEISFSQLSLLKIIEEQSDSSDYYICIERFFDNGEFLFDKKYITNEEKRFFSNYIKTIGGGDKETQIKFLESTHEVVTNKYSVAQEEEKRYKALYIKLGFLIGLMALILVL